MDVGVCIGNRSESIGGYGIDKLPRISAACAVGVGIIVGDGAMSVCAHIHCGIIIVCLRNHTSAAGICNGSGCGFECFVGAGDSLSSVCGNDQLRQLDMMGE